MARSVLDATYVLEQKYAYPLCLLTRTLTDEKIDVHTFRHAQAKTKQPVVGLQKWPITKSLYATSLLQHLNNSVWHFRKNNNKQQQKYWSLVRKNIRARSMAHSAEGEIRNLIVRGEDLLLGDHGQPNQTLGKGRREGDKRDARKRITWKGWADQLLSRIETTRDKKKGSR